jgi:hypothetical protein
VTGASCRRCATPIERGDLRCAICGEATPASEPSAVGEVDARILRCDGCGAAVAYDVDRQAPRCAFCDSVMHVEGVTDPMEQAGWYLSFSHDRAAAAAALKPWLGKLGFLRPSDLSRRASVEELSPIWWVGWVFDADARVSWTADSDAGSRRSAWAPHAGQVDMSFERVTVPASRGLTGKETVYLVPSYDLGRGAEQPGDERGAVVEQFDVQRSAARQLILEAAEATASARVQAGQIPGSRFRNVHVALRLAGLTTRRVAFPAYVLAYRYRGELYRAVVSGQDPRYVTGSAPYSWLKIGALVAGGVALLALVAWLIAAS